MNFLKLTHTHLHEWLISNSIQKYFNILRRFSCPLLSHSATTCDEKLSKLYSGKVSKAISRSFYYTLTHTKYSLGWNKISYISSYMCNARRHWCFSDDIQSFINLIYFIQDHFHIRKCITKMKFGRRFIILYYTRSILMEIYGLYDTHFISP